MDQNSIIKQLERNGRVYQELLVGFTQQQAIWKPSPERWSILETVCHLIDIEIEDFRYDLEITLFHPEQSWPSFSIEDWVVDRKYNERNLRISVEKLHEERNKSVDWLSGLGGFDLRATHSGKGFRREPMRAGDILVSWLAHDHSHIRQIARLSWELLKKEAVPYSSEYSGYDYDGE
ncbi:DinB family protein [Sediminispirochaeta smaragdinae]|uniref:DinB-like domain-containing protein n=1 Tax=Sediminispirochaeta smaragdinae (strain DSM 11293 / JCM 15392 / SEBR 4228) TaxID=573413 RepID=E1R6Y1_SEDSS|nr:DinB family protein [Sediminispirochaeta smaragdinae]ADK81308.1 conserved hypothetical protein [Sediminispirochaeta smaragdinae DSM 11293]